MRLFLFALLLPTLAAAETKELRIYHLSILRSAPDASKILAAERDKLFLEHLVYRRSRYEAGDLLMYGPLEGPPDREFRGVSIWRGDKPIEEIRKLVEGDPYVKGGVVVADVFVWISELPKLDQGFGIRRVEVPSSK